MFDLSEQEIENILTKYKIRKEKDKQKYLQIKDDENFKIKNRARAKAHYEKNKDKKKERYEQNKDLAKARNSYYYYKNLNKINVFQEKYPERFDLLKMYGYFNEQNPFSSTSTS